MDAVEAYVGGGVALARRVGIAAAIGVVFASIRIGGGLTASVLFRILSASRAGTPRSTSVYSRSSSSIEQARQGDEVVRVGEDSEHSHLETVCRRDAELLGKLLLREARPRGAGPASRFAISTSMRVLSPASMISHVRREKLRESSWLRQRFWLEIRAIIGCAHASERGLAQFESHGARGRRTRCCPSAHDVTRHRGGRAEVTSAHECAICTGTSARGRVQWSANGCWAASDGRCSKQPRGMRVRIPRYTSNRKVPDTMRGRPMRKIPSPRPEPWIKEVCHGRQVRAHRPRQRRVQEARHRHRDPRPALLVATGRLLFGHVRCQLLRKRHSRRTRSRPR